MRMIIFAIFTVCSVSNLLGQRNLFNQNYTQIAEDFRIDETQFEDYKSEGKVEIFNQEKHQTKLAKKLLNTKVGKTKSFDKDYYTTIYKVISQQDITHYRIRYIFIDKDKFDTEEAFKNYTDKVRHLLKDTAFKTVAMQYSMDYRKKVGGDSGWFKEGKTHPLFFNEVTNTSRLIEEIFEFEISENNAYYFAQKLWTPKDIKEVLVMYNIEKK